MKRRLKLVAFALVAVVSGLILVEGASSTVVFLYDVVRSSEGVGGWGSVNRYDADLGWVIRANLELTEYYGPGHPVVTNSLGFRDDREPAKSVPEGQARWVFLGDSFTYGEGVGNRDTWVRALESLDGRLDTLNLGVSGYGVDQAYLRYLRDARELSHAVVVLAFISAAFERMRSTSVYAFSKPRLEIRDSALVVANVPVPRPGVMRRWLARNDDIVGKLGFVEIVRRISSAGPLSTAARGGLLSDEELYRVADRMFGDLHRVSRERGSRLVLLHLPVRDESRTGIAPSLPGFLERVSAERGIELVDLVTPFRTLPDAELDRMFIGPEDAFDPSSVGHYTVAGHRRLAAMFHERLSTAVE